MREAALAAAAREIAEAVVDSAREQSRISRGLVEMPPANGADVLTQKFAAIIERHMGDASPLTREPTLNDYAAECRKAADTWYYHPVTGERLTMNQGERLMLIVSELAEAMEGLRKGLMDDKLPHRSMAEVEMADALIRIFDFAGEEGFDLEGAYREKLAYNARRADHKPEARAASNGKKW